MRIVGIDPGSTRVGYALVESQGPRTQLIRAETIVIPKHLSTAERLEQLGYALAKRLRRDRPEAIAVEKLYFAKNAKTALAVAEARGVILLTAQRHVHSIWEYTPLEVKLAVTGYGRADKSHLKRMLTATLAPSAIPKSDDAVDAIAIALAATAIRKFSPLTA